MSKLLEKLDKLAEGKAQALGFSAALSRTKVNQMLLVAGIPAKDGSLAAVAAKNGADALLLPLEPGSNKAKLSKIVPSGIDIPWGASVETASREEVSQLIELGCDFVVFSPAKTAASVLNEERIGKVLRLDPSLSDSLLRSVNRLPVDAVFVGWNPENGPFLTVQQLMAQERLVGFSGKHALVALPPESTPDDVENLWSLGVRGLVIDMSLKDAEATLHRVKEAVEKLPAARKKAGRGRVAILPRIAGMAESPPHEEEDEPDEDRA